MNPQNSAFDVDGSESSLPAEVSVSLDESVVVQPKDASVTGSSTCLDLADRNSNAAVDVGGVFGGRVRSDAVESEVISRCDDPLGGGAKVCAPSISSYFTGGSDGASFFESFKSHERPPAAVHTDSVAIPSAGNEPGSVAADAVLPRNDSAGQRHDISSYFSVSASQATAFDSIALPVTEQAGDGTSNLTTAFETVLGQQTEDTCLRDAQPLGDGSEAFVDRVLPFSGDDRDSNPFLVAERSVENEDRAFDAWIPCPRTQHTLMQVLISFPVQCGAPPDQLTMPGVLSADQPVDNVLQLLNRLKLEADAEKRQQRYVEEFSNDLAGLRRLLAAHSWYQCLELTGHLLAEAGQGVSRAGLPSRHTPDSLKVWSVRLAVLARLKMFAAAEAELQAFGDLDGPDLYYEYYPQLCPGRKGSMVSFGMRLLHALLPQMTGNLGLSLDRLLRMRAIVSKILHNLRNGLPEDGGVIMISEESRTASTKLWCQRELTVLYSLASCLADMKEIELAVKVYEEIASKNRDSSPGAYTSIGRLLLQVGDVNSARTYFHKAHVLEKSPVKKKFNEALNRGYLALASGKCAEACECFTEASLVDEPRLKALAVNNLSVSLVYDRRLTKAVTLLETSVRTDPQHLVHDSVLLNLSTLYDLATPNAFHKKIGVLQLANEHKTNSFSMASFKLGGTS